MVWEGMSIANARTLTYQSFNVTTEAYISQHSGGQPDDTEFINEYK